MKYVCDLCGFIYDDEKIPFGDLPTDYSCPDCGSGKNSFISQGGGTSAVSSCSDRHYDSQR